VDATEDRHLLEIGVACTDLPLITGGSGIALGLPENFRRRGLLQSAAGAEAMPEVGGTAAVLAGSCSAATLGQIETFAKSHSVLKLDPLAIAVGRTSAADALAWAKPKLASGPVLIYASAPPADVAAIQAKLGRELAGALVEQTLADIAAGLVAAGVRRLVVAGGETSGAVVQRLGVTTLRIGRQIDPGVPWTFSLEEPRLALALKSGNFGGVDFFEKALEMVR
ncbi:MAG TPA: nucleotide-binding domain containing protein, partial [Dongiaceae bacterium]